MTVAAYTGTFDPITNGHTDVIRRAAAMFEEVIVAVADSTSKSTLFGLDDRKAFAAQALADVPNVRVEGYDGLTVAFMQQWGVSVMVRGVRSVKDFEYEMQLAQMNRQLAHDVDTIMLSPAPEYGHVSSTLVREIAKYGGDVAALVHPSIASALVEKFA